MRVCLACRKVGKGVERCNRVGACKISYPGMRIERGSDVIEENPHEGVLIEMPPTADGMPIPGDAAPLHRLTGLDHDPGYTGASDRLPMTGAISEVTSSIPSAVAADAVRKAVFESGVVTSPDGNPKTAVGIRKPSLHAIPPLALLHLGRAMAIGNQKYGLVNWRHDPITASTYYNATLRHLLLWQDGEEGEWHELNGQRVFVHHLAFVMANCAILLDAQAQGTLTNDRPTIHGKTAETIKEMTDDRSDRT